MKKHIFTILILLLCCCLVLSACFTTGKPQTPNLPNNPQNPSNPQNPNNPQTPDTPTDTSPTELPPVDIEVPTATDYTVTCQQGTENCYTVTQDGETTITFTQISEKTVYSISGNLVGNIVIDVGDDCKFELELCGLSLVSQTNCPVTVLSADQVTITAKKDFDNYVTDNRPVATDEQYSAAIYSKSDLQLGGKGSLYVTSANNNGIHSKDDLSVKNLSLYVKCADNALKGNDSVTITSGTLQLITTQGDGIKTTNTDLSSKGKQRGTVGIENGDVTIYAACDGVDAAYNVEMRGGKLTIFTDKYSQYSQEVTAVAGGTYYIRCTNKNYEYSVKYTDENGQAVWKNATYYTSGKSGGGRPGSGSTYYYYKVEKPTNCSQMEVFAYSVSQTQGQDSAYFAKSTVQSINDNYDTMALTFTSNRISVGWTNYTTQSGGGWGRPNEGNADKSDHSTKGVKADNEIIISGGTLYAKCYDDALHANSDTQITSTQAKGTGNVTISGGELTLYSNDDGIHADGTLKISDGTVTVTNSYEGLEGAFIQIGGGNVSIVSTDDGVNATTTSGQGLVIYGGVLYVCAGGDGLDSNSRSSYQGIVFEGGKTVVINTSGGNSPIDTEAGYKYTGGLVVAIGASNGMWNESVKCNSSSGFSNVGCYKTNVSAENYVVVSGIATVQMPKTMTSVVIVLGGGTNNSVISTASTCSETLDDNGVCWKK